MPDDDNNDDSDDNDDGKHDSGDDEDDSINHDRNNSDDDNDDNDDNDDSDDNDNEDSPDSNHDKPSSSQQKKYHHYVGTVSTNTGSAVYSDGASLESNSPWIPILMVGTWFEAYGYWDAGSFVADRITVSGDVNWSYYKGPGTALGWDLHNVEGTIEAWIEEGHKIESLRKINNRTNTIRLIAYFDGSKYISLPNKLPVPAPRKEAGWTEILGKYDGRKVTWDSIKSFP